MKGIQQSGFRRGQGLRLEPRFFVAYTDKVGIILDQTLNVRGGCPVKCTVRLVVELCSLPAACLSASLPADWLLSADGCAVLREYLLRTRSMTPRDRKTFNRRGQKHT